MDDQWDGKCIQCGKIVPNLPSRQRKRICSTKCTSAAASIRQKKRFRDFNPPWSALGYAVLPKSTVGAINELRVAYDLLLKGYNVFRALSPACPCDLLILKNGSTFKVEVTSASVSPAGKIMHGKNKDAHKYDILAVVVRDGAITYTPELHVI